MKLYLASISPRRRELLSSLGIPFEVIPPLFEETPTAMKPGEEALYFAEQKAKSVAPQCPKALVIASDTLIDFEGSKLGKPSGTEEAKEILRRLAGKSHHVCTAVVLLDTEQNLLKQDLKRVQVTFKPLNEEIIQEYVASGEPMDKAGAYAIQGKGSRLIEKIEGDPNAVIGLHLEPLKTWLKEKLK